MLLKKGSRGSDVKKLQELLNLVPDGIFGDITLEAIKDFQRTHGLVADGIVGDKTWTALVGLKKSSRSINEIIVHCTATNEGKNYTVDQVRMWHTTPVSKGGRGWSDIGYHYLIYLDGSIHPGRDINTIGAHCSGHNAHSIGVCYVGGLDAKSTAKNPIIKDTRTPQQKASLLKLLKDLKALYPNAKIYGHKNFANKPCPCFDAKKEYSSL